MNERPRSYIDENRQYDAAGNLLYDYIHRYTYDAENRVVTLDGVKTYIYDAEGRRVAKYGTDGTTVTASYVLGLGGEQVSELNAAGAWAHSNVFVGGRLMASYEGPVGKASAGYHYHLTDWLGTMRMQTNASGQEEERCYSYPFGDGLLCTGLADATEHHFTGKERDTESGLDYFGARYLSSNLGRFMTSDWAAGPTDVPYASFGNPQSLNLYAYVGNNPNTGIDFDGHDGKPPSSYDLAAGEAAAKRAEAAGKGNQLPAPPGDSAQQQGSVEDRVIIGVAGAANVYVGADKAAASVVAAISTPVTTGAGVVAAAYEGYQAAGQMAAGVTQLGGAITGHTEKANQEADNITIHSSAVAMATLAVTKDKTMAVNAAAVEGMASSSITRTVFKNAAAVVDTVSNFLQVLFSSKPPVPSQ